MQDAENDVGGINLTTRRELLKIAGSAAVGMLASSLFADDKMKAYGQRRISMHTPIGMVVFQSSGMNAHHHVHPFDQVNSNQPAVIFVAVADMYGDNDKVTLTYIPDDLSVVLLDKTHKPLPASPSGKGQVQEATVASGHPFAYAHFVAPSVVKSVVVHVTATFSDDTNPFIGIFTIVGTTSSGFKRHHRFKTWHRHREIESRYRR